MFTTAGLKKQYDWAHYSYSLLLDHCDTLSDEELHRELPGFGFATVHRQLMHMAETEVFWFRIAQGQQWIEVRDTDYAGMAGIRRLFGMAQDTAATFFDSLGDKPLDTPMRVEWEPGHGVDVSPALVVSHVITHGFHHKGQVVAMCRLLGHPAPETDMDKNIGREG